MKINYRIITLILLLCPFSGNAQARPSMCRIFPLWIGISDGLRSSYFEDAGQFQLDGSEGKTQRSFDYEGLVITAGADYVFDYSKRKQKPYSINLAITVSDKEEKKVFESVNSSEASTLYKKGWNLSVTKNVNQGDKIYMFTLSCNDGLKLPRRK
jgi:hypothetical protein